MKRKRSLVTMLAVGLASLGISGVAAGAAQAKEPAWYHGTSSSATEELTSGQTLEVELEQTTSAPSENYLKATQ